MIANYQRKLKVFGCLRRIRSVIWGEFVRLFVANSFGESWKQVVLNVFPAWNNVFLYWKQLVIRLIRVRIQLITEKFSENFCQIQLIQKRDSRAGKRWKKIMVKECFANSKKYATFVLSKWTIIVEQTFNMPQTPMYKGFEACYVNRLIDFAIILFLTEQIKCLSLDSYVPKAVPANRAAALEYDICR